MISYVNYIVIKIMEHLIDFEKSYLGIYSDKLKYSRLYLYYDLWRRIKDIKSHNITIIGFETKLVLTFSDDPNLNQYILLEHIISIKLPYRIQTTTKYSDLSVALYEMEKYYPNLKHEKSAYDILRLIEERLSSIPHRFIKISLFDNTLF